MTDRARTQPLTLSGNGVSHPPAPKATDRCPRIVMYDPGNFTPYYIDSLCSSLRSCGVRSRVITSPPLFEPVDAADRYQVDPLFFPYLTGWMRPLIRQRRHLRQALRAINYPVGVWRSWQALRDGSPGVLHLHWALLPSLDGLLVRGLKSRGWSVLYTVHDPPTGLARGVTHRPCQSLLALVDAVIVHTPFLARQLADTYPEVRESVHIIPHGGAALPLPSAAERARARQVLGLEPDRPVLLFFGMLKPYKGIEYLLAAMPDVLALFPRAMLVIAGEPLMSLRPLLRQIDRLQLQHAVSVRPRFVAESEVAHYFRAADLLVAPYIEIGASGVVALAQGYGKPVVVTRVGGLPEFVEPDQCGFVVPPRSPGALATAICQGLDDPDRLTAMGRRALRRTERESSWSEVARQTLELYRSVSRSTLVHSDLERH